MNDDFELKYAANMFRHLNSGRFVCSNSCSEEERIWFELLDREWERYREAWKKTTGLVLSRGDQYFFFRRSFNADNLSRKDLEEMYNEAALVVDLIYSLDQSFDVGNNISLTWVLSALDGNTDAQKKCRDITKFTERNDQAVALIKKLKKMGIIDIYMDTDKNEERYVVQSAFRYYLSFIERIQALDPDEEEAVSSGDDTPGLFDKETITE